MERITTLLQLQEWLRKRSDLRLMLGFSGGVYSVRIVRLEDDTIAHLSSEKIVACRMHHHDLEYLINCTTELADAAGSAS